MNIFLKKNVPGVGRGTAPPNSHDYFRLSGSLFKKYRCRVICLSLICSYEKKIVSNSVEETLSFAEELGNNSNRGTVYALFGELGAGKTIIAKGIAKSMGIAEEITSPTFNLLEIYSGRLPLYHFDLYRIESINELDQLFFEEFWEGDGISIIEWADRAISRLPKNYIKIEIEYINNNSRCITVEYPGN